MPPPITPPPITSSRNNESSTSFFEESFHVSELTGGTASTTNIAVPQYAPPQSPLSPASVSSRTRRRPQKALPKIPRNSLRGNKPGLVVKNVKLASRSNSNSNSPVKSNNNNNNNNNNTNHSLDYSKNSASASPNNNNNNNSQTYVNPPSLLPAISSGGSTIATEDVFLDEDMSTVASARRPRRRSSKSSIASNGSAAIIKSRIKALAIQALHASDNDQSTLRGSKLSIVREMMNNSNHNNNKAEVDVDAFMMDSGKSSPDAPPRQPQRSAPSNRTINSRVPSNRTIGSISGISGITEDIAPVRLNDMDEQEQVLLEDVVAQEQAVALATNIFKRSYSSDEGSVGNRSYRSIRSHRSRDQYDPDLAFLHESVHEAALMEMEKDTFDDEDNLIGLAIDEAKEKVGGWWSRTGGMVLCGLLLVCWGGVIPYCAYLNNNREPTEVILTAPPTDNSIPWTQEPTFSPISRPPTTAPTPLNANQELLDLLGKPGPTNNETATTTTISNVTESNVDVVNVTVTNTTDNITSVVDEMDDSETVVVNITFAPVSNVNTTASNATANTSNGTVTVDLTFVNTTAPSVSPTTAPTEGAIVNPATTSPTIQTANVTLNSTLPPSNPNNMTSALTFVPLNSTINTTSTAPTLTPNTNGTVSTSTPSIQPTDQPEVVFPNYTLRAFNNPASPQSKAFSWMLRDPNFGTYSPNRMRQRFALATLYYATNGDDWSIQQQAGNSDARQDLDTITASTSAPDARGGLMPWLSYAGHECDWYYQRTSEQNNENTGRARYSLLNMYSSNLLGVVVCENEFHSDGVFRAYKSLWLENAGLQGTLPPELAMLTGLQQVQLSNNGLFGSLSPQWFWDDKDAANGVNWQTAMEEMILKNNSIAGRIPTQIGLATNLRKMDLQQNIIQRRIPSEIGLLENLQHLLWNDNALTGPIPTEVGRLSSMTACSWNNNQLSGRIPSEVGRCIELQEFYVGQNRLTGSIPWEIMFLRNSLVDLHLYTNQLTRDIPTRFGLLTKLRWFHVGHNQLTGRVPSELAKMTMLQLFQIEDNVLEGEFPPELAGLDIISRAWMHGNTELTGTIPYNWCPGGLLANGTIINVTSDRSVDIRVDCNGGVNCSCAEGCSCETIKPEQRTTGPGFLRG